MSALGDLAPYLMLILVGFLPNEVWRMLGVVLARGLDEESAIVAWVRAVATAVLAAVIARIIVLPPGTLAIVPATVRIGAMALGFAGFFIVRRSTFAGILIGEAALILGTVLFGGQ